MKKRIIGFLLCICMLATLLPMQAAAEIETEPKGEEPETDYFGLWMCDVDHKPNTGGGVSILYELPDGTVPADSGTYWTSSTNQMVPKGTKVTLIANIDPKYQFKGWYQANIDRANPEDPYYLADKLISTEPEYSFVGNPIGEGETPYICAVFEYTGIERFGDQIQIWVGNTDGRDTDSSGMGGKVAVKYTPSEPNVYGMKAKDGTDFVAGEIVQFYKGDEITAYAKPDEGYKFVGWFHVNIEWGPGAGKSYEGELISAEDSFTYKPGETVVPGDEEPLRYVCAVFEAAPDEPTEPTEATEPTTAPTEPTTAPTEPTTAPTEPTTAPTEPTTPTSIVTPSDIPTEPCDGGENCPSKAFTDVNKGDWYHEAVDFAVTKGLFNGMSETTFEPNTPMSRAMLVTVLWRYEGKPEEGKNDFTDVPAGQWYTDAVAWAASNGIVNGVGDGKFDPDGKITREQLAAILFRYSGSKGYDVSKRDDFASFPDKEAVSSWATDAYGWAVAEKLITGNDGKLDPQGNATRAQVATILMRFIENIA